MLHKFFEGATSSIPVRTPNLCKGSAEVLESGDTHWVANPLGKSCFLHKCLHGEVIPQAKLSLFQVGGDDSFDGHSHSLQLTTALFGLAAVGLLYELHAACRETISHQSVAHHLIVVKYEDAHFLTVHS